jgi:effector-binding domain-containing protein
MEATMAHDVEIRDLQPQPIASVRTTTTPAEIGATLTQTLLPRVYAFLADHHLTPSGPPVAVYHEFGPDRVVLEGGVPVAAAFQGDGTVQPSELPGGRVATTRHIGPYERLGETHDAIHQWIADHGHQLAGPTWEVYWMPPGGEPDPGKLVTGVFWKIR